MDRKDKIKILQEKIKEFVIEREWSSYHTPKNLAISVVIEAGELLEHFQWEDKKPEDFTKEEIKEISYEIADVFIYLLHLCDKLKIDIVDASMKKLEINKEKYPTKKYKGKYKKYNK